MPSLADSIRPHPDGVVLTVRVLPRAGRVGVGGVREVRPGVVALVWGVAAAPVEGAANDEICRSIAQVVGVPVRAVEIIVGGTARVKCVLIRGVRTEDVLRLFEDAVQR